MACCSAKSFQPDCIRIGDGLSSHRINSTAQICCRATCGIFCRCSQWSRVCCHHLLMAVFTVFTAAVTATAAFFVGLYTTEYYFTFRSCILFATYLGEGGLVQMNDNTHACSFVFVSEIVLTFLTLLLALWFVIKARLGIGGKAEMWSSLVQLVLLLLVFVLAVTASIITTVGFQHTCQSVHRTLTNTTILCSDLYFYSPELELSIANGDAYFFLPVLILEITAWIGAVFVFILLATSFLSVVGHLYWRDIRGEAHCRRLSIQGASTTITESKSESSPIYPMFGESLYVRPPMPSNPRSIPDQSPDQSPDQPPNQPPNQPTDQLSQQLNPASCAPLFGAALHQKTRLVKKLFSLPCNHAPLFGLLRVNSTVSVLETSHDVIFSIIDRVGTLAPLSSLYQAFFPIFYPHAQASTSSTGEGDIPMVGDPRICHYLAPSPRINFQWLWQDDNGAYSPFDSNTSATLQANYESRPEGSFTYNARKFTYTVDFASMIQTNDSTGRKRMIKYEACSIEWQYKNTQGRFVTYLHDTSEAVERMFVAGISTTLEINGITFTFDFDKRRAICTSTSQAYCIRRVTSPCRVPTAAYKLTLQVEGKEDSLEDAIIDLKDRLGGLLHNKVHVIGVKQGLQSSVLVNTVNFTLNRTVLTILSQKSRCYFVSVLITAAKIDLLGTPEQIDKVMLLLRQLLLEAEKKALKSVDVPQSWSPQTSDFATFKIQRGTGEWDHVQGLIQATVPNALIQSVERIQNLWLWEKYAFAKHRLSKKNHGDVNEKDLFHGTSSISPEKVLKSEHGFDFRKARQGLWGEGAYFAVNASYSGGSYAYHKGNQIQIILAKVLTGDTCHFQQSNNSLKQPPIKPQPSHHTGATFAYGSVSQPPINPRPSHRTEATFADVHYDSVSGHAGNSDIYVVYDHDKAYPAYLITYTP